MFGVETETNNMVNNTHNNEYTSNSKQDTLARIQTQISTSTMSSSTCSKTQETRLSRIKRHCKSRSKEWIQAALITVLINVGYQQHVLHLVYI